MKFANLITASSQTFTCGGRCLKKEETWGAVALATFIYAVVYPFRKFASFATGELKAQKKVVVWI